HPVRITSSSSSRKRRSPASRLSGTAPLRVISRSEPQLSGVVPLIVPEPIRSPTRVLQPETVWCASCCAMLQYIPRKFVRETTSGGRPAGASDAESSMSYACGPCVARYGSGGGFCTGPSTRNGSSASIVTTHGEIDVANDLLLNGPSGMYSHCWMSRALQSFIRTMPNTCESAEPTGTGSPSALPTPTTNAVSSSKSSFSQGPKSGCAASGRFICPFGRNTGVPLTTMELARPLYAIGTYSQLGRSACAASRNIEPTFVACSFDE